MPAYMIVTAQIEDREAFVQGYGMAAEKLVEQFGSKYVLRGPGAELLERGFGDEASMVISEWKDKAAAKAFGGSPEYQEVKKLGEECADYQLLLIEAETING